MQAGCRGQADQRATAAAKDRNKSRDLWSGHHTHNADTGGISRAAKGRAISSEAGMDAWETVCLQRSGRHQEGGGFNTVVIDESCVNQMNEEVLGSPEKRE